MKNNPVEIIPINDLSNEDFMLLSTGQGLMETMKYSHKTVWFKEMHLNRLKTACKRFNYSIDTNVLAKALDSEIERKGIPATYRIRMIILIPFTRNSGHPLKLIIQLLPLPVENTYKKDFSLNLCPTPYGNNPLTNLKTINYGPLFYQKNMAISDGYDDVLFHDEHNHLLEASTSNIFGVKNGKLFTPPLFSPILPGIIRQVFCENMNVIEENIHISNIDHYDYFFITNSIVEMQPVCRINKSLFNYTKNGFDKLLEKWEKIKKDQH